MGHVTRPIFGRVQRVWTRVNMGTRRNGNDITGNKDTLVFLGENFYLFFFIFLVNRVFQWCKDNLDYK